MKNPLKPWLIACSGLLLGTAALAKLPALSDEAKAKAAEAAAKTAWNGKVDAYQLCKAQDKTAANFYKSAKVAGKETRPAAATLPCADPGPFVYTPPEAAGAPVAAASSVPVAAPPAPKP